MPNTIEQIARIDLKDFGEIVLCPGDINGDGKPELIIPQGVDNPKRKASTGGYNHEKTIHCITAIDLEGNILWQNGTPMGSGRRKYHGSPGICPCLVHDLDGDGIAEVVYATADPDTGVITLRLLRGEDGALVAEQETGVSWHIFPADLRGLGTKRDLIINDALTLHFAYAEDLTPIWEWKYIYGGGHDATACDVDGKGIDDLFIGVCRLDAEGNRIWWRPDLDDAMEEMGRCPHIDHVKVEQLYHDSDDYQVLWFGGKDVICLNADDGSVRWRLQGSHLQAHVVGRLDPACPDQMIFVSEKVAGPSYMLSADGTVLWQKDIGRPWGPLARGVGPDGSDLFLNYTPIPGEKPYLMNHLGEKTAEFPMEGAFGPTPDELRTGVTGIGSVGTTCDLDGDNRDEALIFNRKELHIFKMNSP